MQKCSKLLIFCTFLPDRPAGAGKGTKAEASVAIC